MPPVCGSQGASALHTVLELSQVQSGDQKILKRNTRRLLDTSECCFDKVTGGELANATGSKNISETFFWDCRWAP